VSPGWRRVPPALREKQLEDEGDCWVSAVSRVAGNAPEVHKGTAEGTGRSSIGVEVEHGRQDAEVHIAVGPRRTSLKAAAAASPGSLTTELLVVTHVAPVRW